MEILKEIKLKDYTCLICHEDITPESRIWSCTTCFRVFDLKCTQNWSARNNLPTWKCPHCSSEFSERPKQYKCWCKKVRNPDVDYDRPHSCGQSCGVRRQCPHPCTEICHPGAHPPCTAMGPVVKCFCGQQKSQNVCVKTQYKGFSCGEVCGKKLACRKHTCTSLCHSGKCEPCTKTYKAKCYCGKTRKNITCGEGKPEKYRNLPGKFSCAEACGKPLNCGNHFCEKTCHPLTGYKHTCDQIPKPTDTCNCGKTLLSYIGKSRQSCLDPVPNCRRTCDKIMPCGHKCPRKCHEGPCVCDVTVSKTCPCGSTKKMVKCSETVEPCRHKCNAPLSCGRHKCERECCAFSMGKNRITKNMSIDQFLEAAQSQMSDEELAVHLCTRNCNRTLNCGRHKCQSVCHPGQCRRCLEAIHEDYECPCGRTVMRAPIPCGTTLPKCPHQCNIVQPCGHSGTHKCHDPRETPCPPCTAIIRERCLCGKNTVSRHCNIPKTPRCIFSCGKVLECGHKCLQVCHDGECPPCTSTCDREMDCKHKHLHSAPCHGNNECGECLEPMVARCRCGNLRVDYTCGEEYEVFCNDSCLNTEKPYHDVIRMIYDDRPGWASKIETEMRNFVASDKGAYGLKPMKKADRRFVHYLAEHYGLVGVSIDRGPNRSVRVSKTEETWLPKNTIARAIKLIKLHDNLLPLVIDEDAIEDIGFSD